jgi:hypothetical protein
VAQVPNVPFAFAIVAAVASRFLNEGSTAYFFARAVFFVGFAIWAYLELVEGVNGFRRVLGAAGIAYVLWSITRELS